ncbi:hypothetical protein COV88_03800 [Candidatus Saccharibacteria bacterium CG11_big_fil_rev_8_21_14_0_20_41_19]|nr:prepilin-type N-terminal cleavage/methylation domain-containing protein [Candidatus Saccharibacteria bacterium]OIP85677.1 MAG: hypothetical protein AUK57_02310 [Candidatus Saccharibacteria bacterium CG2_30_41_52]PIQ70548.1 MAG: hypothetical protein COV88_03800 [Candidatus Saccharibacteria bacterium CG11_big_fil_rev_8_21_14_0_20_41_19]PIZ60872.1 MAG: hypothetical protein COY18_00620 [Candidatus Saccharibacteria bacterium CG_4_10_14_0_2_um_filter_41_11]PJC29443.1 MAG: hypothetical protein CO05
MLSIVNRRFDRGDTLIEVLFAITIFSLVAVGGLAIMNQGTATSQRALEITLVRQEIDAQAEVLRFLNASFVSAYQSGAVYASNTPAGQWQLMESSIISTGMVTASAFGAGSDCQMPPQGSFIINTRSATFIPPTDAKLGLPQTFAQVRYDTSDQVTMAEGIWIEAVRAPTVGGNNQSNAGYIDFNIRACWESPGQAAPVTIGTIVRLYEPRG